MKPDWKLIILLALAVTGLSTYIFEQLQDGTTSPADQELRDGFERVPTQQVPQEPAPENVSVQVRASRAGWSPQNITVASGDNVTLHLRSTDGKTYRFSLPAYGISEQFSTDIININFIARTPGEWEFYNSHPDANGIRGYLVISE